MIALFFLVQLAFVYGFYRVHLQLMNHAARLTAIEQSKPKSVVSAPQPTKPERRIWDKEIEGFNPKAPKIVLPRTDEQKNQRVCTDWEIESDFNMETH
jgi:hypothetical protein